MVNKIETLNKIAAFKAAPFKSTIINAEFEGENFNLVLITKECENMPNIIDLLSKWRKENEDWFTAIFPVTHEGTKVWMRDRLINEPDRILFLIEVKGEFIGHVGLWRFDFDTFSCEIDNIVRGEKSFPGIMYNAISEMHNWGRKQLGIKNFYLQTFLENEKAINLYKKLDYEIIKVESLQKVSNGNRIEWIKSDDIENAERHNIHM
jgi:RimJ/RimL family protein N-acetyltransferase